MAHLLEPEAGGGAVEHPKQLKVIILGRAFWQLDHRRRPIAYLAAMIVNEMIMGSDKCDTLSNEDPEVACGRPDAIQTMGGLR